MGNESSPITNFILNPEIVNYEMFDSNNFRTQYKIEFEEAKMAVKVELVQNGRKFDLQVSGEEINAKWIFDPGSAEKLEGKLVVTKNFIGILEKGMNITEINRKFMRSIYDVYYEPAEDMFIIADGEESLEEMRASQVEAHETAFEEKVNEAYEKTEPVLKKETISGEKKARLTKEDKEAYKEKFKKEIQFTPVYRSLKTVKEKAIYLVDREYPVSAIAYILDKKFQQIRGYVVDYLGKNLKAL